MCLNSTEQEKRTKATLILEDGTQFEGFSFGAEENVSGEIVFQTGMVGYVESLTDPSYRRQLVCLTYPLIGNYGVPKADNADEADQLSTWAESSKIWAGALIVEQHCNLPSHWNSVF